VLLAGAAGISLPKFAVAVGIGRGLRYFALGLLAIEYGDRALGYLHEHGTAASLIVIGVVVGGAAAYLLWSRTSRQKAR
jgi:membrane protein DedA with SNARE-associated domain